jgi:drug/metabolite transporter (DMT)-like permease
MRDLYTWLAIFLVVLASTAGDVFISHAMKKVGDVGDLRRRRGLVAVMQKIFSRHNFFFGIACMAVAFYSLLFALSWNDVSLVGPAAASLTFVANAVAARIFLHENVDKRRWMAALFVAGGVFLLTV